MCTVSEPTGDLRLIAEQVSHHPPCSVVAMLCPQLEVVFHQTFTVPTAQHCRLLTHYAQDSSIIDSVIDHHDAVLTTDGRLRITVGESEVYDFRDGLPPMHLHNSVLSDPYGHLDLLPTHVAISVRLTTPARFTWSAR